MEPFDLFVSVREQDTVLSLAQVVLLTTMKQMVFMVLLLLVQVVSMAQDMTAERARRDSAMALPILQVSYSVQVPFGDLADRFGIAHNIGAAFAYKTKSNWIFSLGGSYVFGDQVENKNLLLDEMLTPNNIIIGNTGGPAIINIGQAGYVLDMRVGKIFPILRPNKNSGPIISIGGAFMEHWITYAVENNTIPQLQGDYLKGYDRLTNGFMLNQFIGYHFQGNTRLLNFYGGFEFTQGFMGNRRSYDIPEQRKIDPNLTYFQFGFRIGWMLPFYKRDQNEYYTN